MPVVTGCSANIAFTHDLYRGLYDLAEDNTYLRTPGNFSDSFGMDDLLAFCDDFKGGRLDHFHDYYDHVVYVNLSPFSTLEMTGESSSVYWARNKSCTSGKNMTNYRFIVEALEDDFNVKIDMFLEEKLSELYTFAPHTGVLYQIFVNPDVLDDVLLISKASGVPLENWKNKSSEFINDLIEDPVAFKKSLEEKDFIEEDANWVSSQIGESFRGEVVHLKPWHIQGRLIVNPDFTSNLETCFIKKYYWNQPEEEALKEYQEKLAEFKVFLEGVKKDTSRQMTVEKRLEDFEKGLAVVEGSIENYSGYGSPNFFEDQNREKETLTGKIDILKTIIILYKNKLEAL